MKTKRKISIISCMLMALLFCQGIVGCTSTEQDTSSKKVIYKAMLPQGVSATFKDWENSIRYTYHLQFENFVSGTICRHTQRSYAYEYVDDYRNFFADAGITEITTQQLGDMEKRVLYFTYNSRHCAKIRGTLYRGEEIIIIDKDYTLAKEQTTIDEEVDIPTRVTMYCRQGDVYYIVNLSGFSEAKSDEWLLSFGLDLSSNINE